MQGFGGLLPPDFFFAAIFHLKSGVVPTLLCGRPGDKPGFRVGVSIIAYISLVTLIRAFNTFWKVNVPRDVQAVVVSVHTELAVPKYQSNASRVSQSPVAYFPVVRVIMRDLNLTSVLPCDKKNVSFVLKPTEFVVLLA